MGWSLFVDGKLADHGRYVQRGTAGRHGEKLSHFADWLKGLLERERPDRLVYEKPYQGRMRNTFGILSRYVGVLEAVAFRYFEAELDEDDAVPAHLVKKAIKAPRGRNHDDNKRIVVELINQAFDLALVWVATDAAKSVSQDDEADAIAVNWAWHIMHVKEG